jgi:hypothetical protein
MQFVSTASFRDEISIVNLADDFYTSMEAVCPMEQT